LGRWIITSVCERSDLAQSFWGGSRRFGQIMRDKEQSCDDIKSGRIAGYSGHQLNAPDRKRP